MQAEQLLIVNDSSFGPIFDIDEVLKKRDECGADVYGITDSYETRYHLQSYFLLFGHAAISASEFTLFWESVGWIQDKSSLVLEYEIGLTQQLMEAGLMLDCLAPAMSVGFLNNTHMRWLELIVEYRSPFIKVELLRDNPLGRDLSEFQSTVESSSHYPIYLIETQLDLATYQSDEHKNSVQIL